MRLGDPADMWCSRAEWGPGCALLAGIGLYPAQVCTSSRFSSQPSQPEDTQHSFARDACQMACRRSQTCKKEGPRSAHWLIKSPDLSEDVLDRIQECCKHCQKAAEPEGRCLQVVLQLPCVSFAVWLLRRLCVCSLCKSCANSQQPECCAGSSLHSWSVDTAYILSL